jgi:hypothetical protein
MSSFGSNKKNMPNSMKGGRCLLLLFVLALLSWGMYECNYRISLWRDYQQRPWAYSKDKDAKLLVGKWQGQYKDPDGVVKAISLEIFEPLSDAERRKKAGNRHRRRARGGLGSRKDKRLFEGVATVTSSLGQEDYTLYGSVAAEDYHQLAKVQFGAQDETTRLQPNFALNLAQSGHWAEDNMTIQVSFTYFKADGSSFSDSADPRYEKLEKLVLRRK